jgi:hypothetical protein
VQGWTRALKVRLKVMKTPRLGASVQQQETKPAGITEAQIWIVLLPAMFARERRKAPPYPSLPPGELDNT